MRRAEPVAFPAASAPLSFPRFFLLLFFDSETSESSEVSESSEASESSESSESSSELLFFLPPAPFFFFFLACARFFFLAACFSFFFFAAAAETPRFWLRLGLHHPSLGRPWRPSLLQKIRRGRALCACHRISAPRRVRSASRRRRRRRRRWWWWWRRRTLLALRRRSCRLRRRSCQSPLMRPSPIFVFFSRFFSSFPYSRSASRAPRRRCPSLPTPRRRRRTRPLGPGAAPRAPGRAPAASCARSTLPLVRLVRLSSAVIAHRRTRFKQSRD